MKLNMIVSAAVICFGITNCGKKDKTEPQPENNVEAVQCSYNIDGELHQGSSKAECEALAEELGLNDLSFSGTVVCQVNVNGEIFDGNSQDECKEVFESLGLEIDFTDFFEREKAPEKLLKHLKHLKLPKKINKVMMTVSNLVMFISVAITSTELCTKVIAKKSVMPSKQSLGSQAQKSKIQPPPPLQTQSMF